MAPGGRSGLAKAAAVTGLRDIYTVERAEAMNAAGNALRGRLNKTLGKHGVKGQVTATAP